MTRKQDDDLLPTFSAPLDETVAEILSEGKRKKDEMQLSPEERRRVVEQRRKEAARKETAREKARKQNRVTLILPPDLVERIEEIAGWQGVTNSQVVTFFLYETLSQYEQGTICFDEYKQPSYNPRYDFELIHPQDKTRQKHRSEKKRKCGWG